MKCKATHIHTCAVRNEGNGLNEGSKDGCVFNTWCIKWMNIITKITSRLDNFMTLTRVPFFVVVSCQKKISFTL